MITRTALALALLAQSWSTAISQTNSSNVIGRWQIEVIFQNGQNRSLQFDARPSGKGSLRLIIPGPISVGSGAAAAEWTRNDEHSVTFRGPVEFPLGNVGIERGTLVLTGKLERTAGSFGGEARLFSSDQDPKAPDAKPSKTGTFKATRLPY